MSLRIDSLKFNGPHLGAALCHSALCLYLYVLYAVIVAEGCYDYDLNGPISSKRNECRVLAMNATYM